MRPVGESFPKRLRLLKASEFKRVFQDPCKIGDRSLALLTRPNGLDYPRLGLAVGRKSASRAVDRSRLKRSIRESFRRHQRLLAGLDIVVLAGRGCAAKTPAQLNAALTRYWSELVRKCKPS